MNAKADTHPRAGPACPVACRPRARARGGRGQPIQAGRGFALIEALVALLLFSLGILGMIGLQARAVSIAGDAEDRTRAALIADQCASEIQLHANGMTASSTQELNGLVGLCQADAWTGFVNSPARGGLPNGTISTSGPFIDSTAATIVPVSIDITVKWQPPARTNANGVLNAAALSQLTTRVTLLLRKG